METFSKRWYKRWWGVSLMIFAVFMLSLGFAFVLFVYNFAKTIDQPNAISTDSQIRLTAEEQRQLVGTNSYWIGAANPKVTIVEFADFACPHCENSFPNIREITLEYAKDIKFVYRDFPALGDTSVKLALAARCAGEQGLFWPMHDKLFQNQGLSDTADLAALANRIGADLARFTTCLSSQKYISAVQQDFALGQELGVAGTPTWFINGYKIEGDIPHDTFIQIIENLLQNN